MLIKKLVHTFGEYDGRKRFRNLNLSEACQCAFSRAKTSGSPCYVYATYYGYRLTTELPIQSHMEIGFNGEVYSCSYAIDN